MGPTDWPKMATCSAQELRGKSAFPRNKWSPKQEAVRKGNSGRDVWKACVLVCIGYHSNIPQTGWLK